MVKTGRAKPNFFVVRLQVMFASSYVFQPKPPALKGRSQRTIGREAVSRFGNPDFIFHCSKGGDPYRRVPLVTEIKTGRPVLSGYAFIGEWIAAEWEKWVNDESRLAPGTAIGVPWK